MSETTAIAPATEPAPEHPDVHPHRRYTQLVVLAGVALCVAVSWYAGDLLRIPAHRPYEASLLLQPGIGGKVGAIVAAAVLFAGCVLLAELLAGRHWLYSGPFAAAWGLATWSCLGGPARYVYLHAGTVQPGDTSILGKTIFLMLALELVLLIAPIGAVWYLLTRHAVARLDPDRPIGPLTGSRMQGLAMQVALMAFLLLILTPTDAKGQVVAAVFVSAAIATWAAEHFFREERLGAWWWIGPLAVGLIGYVGNYFSGPAAVALQTGHLEGAFAPLGRAVPLDYAGAGTAGALMGYWMGVGERHPVMRSLVLHRNVLAAPQVAPGNRGATGSVSNVPVNGRA